MITVILLVIVILIIMSLIFLVDTKCNVKCDNVEHLVDADVYTIGNNGTVSCDDYCSKGINGESKHGSKCVQAKQGNKTLKCGDLGDDDPTSTSLRKSIQCKCVDPPLCINNDNIEMCKMFQSYSFNIKYEPSNNKLVTCDGDISCEYISGQVCGNYNCKNIPHDADMNLLNPIYDRIEPPVRID